MAKEKYEIIINKWYPLIYNYVYFRVLNKEICEDIVSDTFIKAMADESAFDDERLSFGPWLYTIARNTLIDVFRKSKTSRFVALESQKELAGSDDPTQFFFAREDASRLRSFLSELTPREREIISLRYWGNLSYIQIADQTGLSVKNVSVILTRTLARLRKKWMTAA